MRARAPAIGNASGVDVDNLPREHRAEENVLTCLLVNGPAAVPLDVLARLAPTMFLDGTHRAIFDMLGSLHAAGAPCARDDVTAALRKAKLKEVAARAFALATEPGALPPSLLSGEVDKLAEAAGRRETLAVAGRIHDASLNGVPVADLLAGVRADVDRIEGSGAATPPRIMVEFLTPSACRGFTPPEGWNIVGSYHVQRGSPFVIGGAPGVGKSRAANALAVAGATRDNWFGLTVHRRFKTMILQAENGRVRLKDEFSALDDPALDEFIRVCPPPPFGFAFERPEFCNQLAAAVAEFKPDVFIVDPWNRATADDKSKDYLATFTTLLSLLPTGENAPALGIVAHTRKPQAGERSNGRGLLNILAGGYALGSVPRAAFVIQHASDDPEENRVVWTCCKNNDGELGPPSVWERANGLFTPVENFDWQEFDAPAEKRRTIRDDDVASVFRDAQGEAEMLSLKEATARLMKATGCGRSACYDSLNTEKGKFKVRLSEKGGLLAWK